MAASRIAQWVRGGAFLEQHLPQDTRAFTPLLYPHVNRRRCTHTCACAHAHRQAYPETHAPVNVCAHMHTDTTNTSTWVRKQFSGLTLTSALGKSHCPWLNSLFPSPPGYLGKQGCDRKIGTRLELGLKKPSGERGKMEAILNRWGTLKMIGTYNWEEGMFGEVPGRVGVELVFERQAVSLLRHYSKIPQA